MLLLRFCLKAEEEIKIIRSARGKLIALKDKYLCERQIFRVSRYLFVFYFPSPGYSAAAQARNSVLEKNGFMIDVRTTPVKIKQVLLLLRLQNNPRITKGKTNNEKKILYFGIWFLRFWPTKLCNFVSLVVSCKAKF